MAEEKKTSQKGKCFVAHFLRNACPNQYWYHYATSVNLVMGSKFGLLYVALTVFFFTLLTHVLTLGQPITKCTLAILVRLGVCTTLYSTCDLQYLFLQKKTTKNITSLPDGTFKRYKCNKLKKKIATLNVRGILMTRSITYLRLNLLRS